MPLTLQNPPTPPSQQEEWQSAPARLMRCPLPSKNPPTPPSQQEEWQSAPARLINALTFIPNIEPLERVITDIQGKKWERKLLHSTYLTCQALTTNCCIQKRLPTSYIKIVSNVFYWYNPANLQLFAILGLASITNDSTYLTETQEVRQPVAEVAESGIQVANLWVQIERAERLIRFGRHGAVGTLWGSVHCGAVSVYVCVRVLRGCAR
eukprot:1157037-Pelagomonas_calceolata.AAC.3